MSETLAWLMFMFHLGVAVFAVFTLYALLSENARHRRRGGGFFIGLMVCILGMLGTSIGFVADGNAMAEGFEIPLKYSISAFPIIALIMAVAATVVHFVLASIEKRKENATAAFVKASADTADTTNAANEQTQGAVSAQEEAREEV